MSSNKFVSFLFVLNSVNRILNGDLKSVTVEEYHRVSSVVISQLIGLRYESHPYHGVEFKFKKCGVVALLCSRIFRLFRCCEMSVRYLKSTGITRLRYQLSLTFRNPERTTFQRSQSSGKYISWSLEKSFAGTEAGANFWLWLGFRFGLLSVSSPFSPPLTLSPFHTLRIAEVKIKTIFLVKPEFPKYFCHS